MRNALFIGFIVLCLSPWPAISVVSAYVYDKPLTQCFLSHRLDCE